ncbi:hypothetical protein [Nocardioides sp. SR21]|uniref:hypothetical protein n=1 Tax=Nocardioides sp. SR21 TaxID=2919501 RepID=UPI001FA9967F|nr:hypothetical protein [Nocardioides sp. SR21]
MRRRPLIVGAVVLVLVAGAAVVGVRWWQGSGRSDLEQAAGFAPYDAQRLSWTDWADVRAEVGTDDLPDLLGAGFDADLTSASALVESAPLLQARFGFSPATAEWELFSQSESGAVVIVRVPDDTDLEDVADTLEETGFTRPADDEGVWMGGAELLPAVGARLTPELQYVALDADDHLVLTSDNESYLAETVETLGDGELPAAMADVVAASGDPLTASVYDGAYTCAALAMTQADAADQELADRLVADAGEVNPISAFAMSVQPDRGVRVAMGFENDDQARANADSRAVLAEGPAPGQGGEFGDRFTVDTVAADGDVVTMDLEPKKGSFVFSDLASGPVLFATC